MRKRALGILAAGIVVLGGLAWGFTAVAGQPDPSSDPELAKQIFSHFGPCPSDAIFLQRVSWLDTATAYNAHLDELKSQGIDAGDPIPLTKGVDQLVMIVPSGKAPDGYVLSINCVEGPGGVMYSAGNGDGDYIPISGLPESVAVQLAAK